MAEFTQRDVYSYLVARLCHPAFGVWYGFTVCAGNGRLWKTRD